MTIFQEENMNINQAQLEIAGESNIGLVRHHNEDNFLIYAPPGGDSVLAVVADGIGGHSRGETASYICCRELFKAARTAPVWDKDFLHRSLIEANRKIFDFNFKGQRVKPMGCTVVAAVFSRERVICASAGDSRMYEFSRLANQKSLRQLTTDHRPEGYEELFSSGELRYTNLVSRSLGTAKHLEIDILEISRPDDARYLLCSDGLYNRQPDQLLAGILGSDRSARKITGELIRGALLAGERDNITVICAAPVRKEK